MSHENAIKASGQLQLLGGGGSRRRSDDYDRSLVVCADEMMREGSGLLGKMESSPQSTNSSLKLKKVRENLTLISCWKFTSTTFKRERQNRCEC